MTMIRTPGATAVAPMFLRPADEPKRASTGTRLCRARPAAVIDAGFGSARDCEQHRRRRKDAVRDVEMRRTDSRPDARSLAAEHAVHDGQRVLVRPYVCTAGQTMSQAEDVHPQDALAARPAGREVGLEHLVALEAEAR